MAYQLSPGVVVTEEDRTLVVPQVATSAGAVAGAFQWGPVNEPITVDTEGTLVSVFGKPDDTTAGYFFTAANFLSYGNNLKVVRVVDKGQAQNAVSSPSGQVTSLTLNSTSNTFLSAGDVVVTIDSPESGTQAIASAVLASTGAVNDISLVSGGEGYNTPPTITFSGTGLDQHGSTAVAQLSLGSVSVLEIRDGGNNYTNSSNIVFQNPVSGTPATATLGIHYKLQSIAIVEGGVFYDVANANIQFSGNLVAGGNHATAVPIIDDGVITGITITNSGNGYIGAPNVIINRNNEANIAASPSAGMTASIGYGYINTIAIVNDGGTYTVKPNVTINRNNILGGTDADVGVRISARVGSITVTGRGSDWPVTPGVVITPASADVPYITANASATARLGYEIDSFDITNPGSGYTSTPTVTVTGTAFGGTADVTAAIAYNAPLIENLDDYLSNHSSGGYGYGMFAAKWPGTLGNSLKVSIADANSFTGWQYANQFDSAPATSSYASSRGGSNDEIHVIVVDATGTWTGQAGTVLEKFSFLSKGTDSKNSDQSTNYYKDVINNQSGYIWVLDNPTAGTNWGTTVVSKAFAQLSANVTNTLTAGTNGNDVSSGNVQAGYELFSNDEEYDVSLIAMGPTTNIGVVNTVIGIAESRRDCIVFVSPEYSDVVNTTNQATNITDYRNSLTSSSFAVMDSGWKYQYDRYSDKYRYIPLNGDIAGLSARTDFVADPWYSPAGYNRGVIKNVVKLAYSPSKTDRDTLYKKGVNPVVTFPGQGTVLFGDKTLLARSSAFDRINVRRLFIILEKAVSTASKFQLFEFNDAFSRAQFKNLVEPFLRDVQGRRGITDFRVVCDESNNTAEVVDRNEFVADIYVKPARSINFIQLNFVATRSGVSFEEVGA